MKRKTNSETKFSGTAFITESPAERFFTGMLKTILGMLIVFSIIVTTVGISKFGSKDFFQRMKNTVHSLSSDYYDIRTDEFDDNTVYFGKVIRMTNADVRKAPACLKMDESKHHMLPGAFGTTTLYIIPNDTDRDMDIELEFNTYGARLTDNGKFKRLSDDKNQKSFDADNYLNGHILFFTENNGSYSGLLKDGRMIYNTAEHREDLNENGEYKLTVYWIWPEYYEQLVNTRAEGAVITDRIESDMIRDYIRDHQNEFFYVGEGINRSDDPGDQYDNADLFIHQNVEYIGFEIIALN
ncbi:hypothetical protein SAMN02910317_02000 [Ruminococcaceae bacterium FB2012]|nr:hypothetical protein SAMN02910317_02000 [Ruminococcaceae bacterium FB2012]